jgi:hypothetical protein
MHSTPSEELRRGVRSAALERRLPEWDPATDLLAEEAATKSIRWRRMREQRGAFRPRWRRRSPPEAAGITGRRRGDSGFAGAGVRGEERGEGEGLGWVGLTDADPSRLGSTSWVGWVGLVDQGPLVYLNQIQNFKLWFKILIQIQT